MIFIKGDCVSVSNLPEKAKPILFYIYGVYFYVESGIVENELQVLKHWELIEKCNSDAIIIYKQGTQIPIELGDYLVAHQNDNQTSDETEQTEN